jgi:DSF synthase
MLLDTTSPASGAAPVPLLAEAAQSPSTRLWPDLGQLDCMHDISNATLWSFMDFRGRPSYNPDLLKDFHGWQKNIASLKEQAGDALKYVVLGSRRKGAFCFGGDLDYFTDSIEQSNSYALAEYGLSCIEILHRNWQSCDSEVITIGLVQGDALGGGFESLLSFDIIVAEKGTRFGFPEQMFGLFPGMGALTFLGRKLGTAAAEMLVRTGKLMTAEELYELGIVHVLAEPGQGIEATRRYIQKNAARHAGHYRMMRAMKRANPISFEELQDIVWLWVEACMTLEKHNLAVMRRLVHAQSKMSLAA